MNQLKSTQIGNESEYASKTDNSVDVSFTSVSTSFHFYLLMCFDFVQDISCSETLKIKEKDLIEN